MLNAITYLRSKNTHLPSDLNYCTHNGINFYVGFINSKAMIGAFIEDDEKFLITKEDLLEMVHCAKIEGIATVELHTNYGVELHSVFENSKSYGIDKIVKVVA